MGRAMRKRVFRHMRTPKAQISLRIRAVWSGHSLFANRVIDTIECMYGEQIPRLDHAHTQDDVNPYIFRMFEGTVSFDTA